MPDHHYRVGQMVALTVDGPSGAESPGGRLYKIIQLLPAAWGGTCYRIKSIVEEADRIVPEASLGDETCISRDVWDRMLARASWVDREARSPRGSEPAIERADIHVHLDVFRRWVVDTGTGRPALGSYRHRVYAMAYARALAHSRHTEMIVHEATGGTVRHARATLTYPARLD